MSTFKKPDFTEKPYLLPLGDTEKSLKGGGFASMVL